MNSNIIKGVPSVKEAYLLLEEAGKLNPGPWTEHSQYAAKAARLIAKQCSHLDPDKAFVLGLLHDIGRRAGKTWMRHSIDGYNFAMLKGYDFLAKISITHSFDCKDITTAFGEWDCTPIEYNFVQEYLETIEYDDYDRLIQLCDALALPKGFCLIEKRMVESTIRNGINENVVLKWKATMENKKYFENIMGKSIYSILPGVVENTFDF
jgi:hypothetical protein